MFSIKVFLEMFSIKVFCLYVFNQGQLHKPHFTCPVHKDYRVYQVQTHSSKVWFENPHKIKAHNPKVWFETGNLLQDALLKFSDWAIVGTTILSVPIVWPLTAVANTLDLDLVAIFKVLPSKSRSIS